MKPLAQRLLTKYSTDPDTGCWNWTGHTYPDGYGRIREFGSEKRFVRAHRVSYQHFHGPVPDGLVVMHKCDNKRCINPDHLEVGTSAQNVRDAHARGLVTHMYRGMPAPQTKLTPDQVAVIRQKYAAGGVSQAAIGREFGVSKNTIQALICGRSWAGVRQNNGSDQAG